MLRLLNVKNHSSFVPRCYLSNGNGKCPTCSGYKQNSVNYNVHFTISFCDPCIIRNTCQITSILLHNIIQN